MKRWFGPGFLLVIFLALGLRLPQLRLRPFHNDESVNAVKFVGLWERNAYQYDPNEFHGPSLPYLTLPAAALSPTHFSKDFNEATFRVVTCCFGVGLILLFLLLARDLGRAEMFCAAIFAALSPAMVFYSRYYIHEMLLVFFTALAGLAWWRQGTSRHWGWAVSAGLGFGLMWATKETFVFSIAAVVAAIVCVMLWNRIRGEPASEMRQWPVKFYAIAGLMALGTGLIFFSSFGTHWHGVIDSFATYGPWLHRAEGTSPHVNPWYFYFNRLLFFHARNGPVWSEGFVVALAVVGFFAALFNRGMAHTWFARLLAFYTLGLTLIYTALPYKTPWCLLDFYVGMVLLAGIGAGFLLQRFATPPGRCVLLAVLIAGTIQLGCQARRANFGFDRGGAPLCDSPKNPYTYSQTLPDVFRLTQTVGALAAVSPEKDRTVIEVMSKESYWPLPWYLREFPRLGFWDSVPDQPLAPIMIVSTELHAAFDDRPEKSHLMAGYFELRPGVFFELYVRLDLWTAYLKTAPRED